MTVASVIQTIPSLALLAAMVPVLAALGLRSIGFLPAFIGLVLYSLLPILRNTVTGIDSIDTSLIEAARGVGMTPSQQLRSVELPLAMPVIVAGIRITAVTQIAVATVAAYINAGGLGDIIFQGITQDFGEKIVAGAVLTSLLAIVVDEGLKLVERHLRAATAEQL